MERSFLLDTHTLLWALSGNSALSERARLLIADSSNSIFVSMASLWEIAIKVNLGKLQLGIDLVEFPTLLIGNNISILPISFEHILELATLESIHRDPFDRIIIAQSKHERLTIITKDRQISRYGNVQVVW